MIAVLGFAGIWWARRSHSSFIVASTFPGDGGISGACVTPRYGPPPGPGARLLSEGPATDAVDFVHAPKSVISRQAALNRAVRPP